MKTCGTCKWSYPAYVPSFVTGWVDPIRCGAPDPMLCVDNDANGRRVGESTACADTCPLYVPKEVEPCKL